MWVPLHLHSQYSILDAACGIEEIAKRAKTCNMPACALTDHGNMHGAVDFYKACKEEKVKPLIGCEFYVAPESRFEKKKIRGKSAFHLILIAKNTEGYHNLCHLTSLAYLEGFYYHPRIDKELLKKYASGLVCLSACLSSQVAYAALEGSQEEFIQEIQWHKDLFGEDYYLELQRHTMSEEKLRGFEESWLLTEYEDYIARQTKVNNLLIQAGRTLGIKCVATNDTHYIDPEDWKAHEILLNIQSGEPVEIWEKDALGNPKFKIPNPKRRVYSSRECYFKTPEEMQLLFQDIPEAITNTLEVAEKCNLTLDFTTRHYPIYVPPELEGKPFTSEEQRQASVAFLKNLCEEGISKRYTPEILNRVKAKYPDKDIPKVVRERFEKEFETITSKNMCDYLLIVWDFINWAKKNKIPVGPGRGSGAGSIILYLIGVTDIEPLSLHLFFERFINPERPSYPDIDVDICMAQRQAVIDYTVGRYGKESVAQIITFGTMKARMTIKDVGRVLSVPLAKVNQIAGFVPEDPNMTLAKALEIDPDLHRMYLEDADAKAIIDVGRKLEGSIRNVGIHAAGIIICRDSLMDHIPICVTKDAQMAVTQYSMKPVELVGMLKIDFLGLKTLTAIQLAVDAIAETTQKHLPWTDLPLDDFAAYALLQQGKTSGIFQMESGGMQELARQLKPDKFEEIIAIGALYRPGPMDMIPSFIQRKHGKEKIEYEHPLLESILSETYGIMVYQEQVMHIATQMAGYSLGEGDVLRRAMGKKDKIQMEKEREKFVQGSIHKGISHEIAASIFDKMEKFAAYGFNKSHAAAYGYLTYVTAFLKANYPREWIAAMMTCDRDDIDKVGKFLRECHAMGIAILPPDINESSTQFVATPHGIRFAISGIKGVGEAVVEAIIQERKKGGKFTDLYNFFTRLSTARIGKKMVECLVDAGCFDFTGWSRDALRESIDPMHEEALKADKENSLGILSLFSLLGEEEKERFKEPPFVKNPLTKEHLLRREKELLGFFLTSHPMLEYQEVFKKLKCVPLSELETLSLPAVLQTAFIIEKVETKISHKNQKKFAILSVSDGMSSYEIPVFSELYERKGFMLLENKILYGVVQIEKREDKVRLSCPWFEELQSEISDEKITAFGEAFKSAKNRFSRNFTLELPPAMSSSTQTAAVQNLPPLVLKAQLSHLRLSHILKLKELFLQYPGHQKVVVEFHTQGKKTAHLHVEGLIHAVPEFLEKLREISSIKS